MDKETKTELGGLKDLIERRFTEVKEIQVDVQKRVGNLEILNAAQGEQLKYHIKRTDLAEERTELYRKEAAERAESIRKEAEKGDAAIYQKMDEQRKEVDVKMQPLLTHEAARKISWSWINTAVTLVITILGVVGTWLALRH